MTESIESVALSNASHHFSNHFPSGDPLHTNSLKEYPRAIVF